jgi:hypothetical protein
MLSTVDRLKNHLGIPLADTSKDAKLEKILKGASAFVERQCSRSFGVAEHVEKHDGDDTTQIQLRQFPVQEGSDDSGIVLTIGGTVIDLDAEIEAGQAAVDYGAGIITRDRGFDAGEQNVRVTYTAGYVLPDDSSDAQAQTLPEDIEFATLKLAGRGYERSTAEGTSNANAGSFSVGFAKDVDPEIQATLDTHAKIIIA